MSRKDVFSSLSSITPPETVAFRNRARPLLGSPALIEDTSQSPVGAIGQSLSELNQRNRRAEMIERRLAEGQTVVRLAPRDIDVSFVPDRMPQSEADDEGLVSSIREHGQQVPILVRPHPTSAGRYQVAFGHRRLKAASLLDMDVLAVVRDLTDEQLVIAQGQENNERQDLSYIEKVRFAQRLQARFSRDVIMAAMSIYKSDLSNMLSVAARIPAELVDMIGPAPGVGRRSWIDLADLLEENGAVERAERFLANEPVQRLASKDRFKALLAEFKPEIASPVTETWLDADGGTLARIKQDGTRVEIVIDRARSPDFAAFVLERLPTLFEDFQSKDRK